MINERIKLKRSDTMKKELIKFIIAFAMFLPAIVLTFADVQDALSLEPVIGQEKTAEKVHKKDIVPIVDNVIILFDSSSSTSDKYKKTGKRIIEVEKQILRERAGKTPDNDLNIGLYSYGRKLKTFYEMQPFNREMLINAIDQLPEKGSGPTLLSRTIQSLEPILEGLSGKTVVFLFSDGSYSTTSSKRPVQIARELAAKYDVNFQIISTTSVERQQAIMEAVASINESSRVIAFELLLNYPEYYSSAVFVIEESYIVEYGTRKKIVALKLDDLLFDFGTAKIKDKSIDELAKVGKVLVNKPETYVVLAGFTDNVGPEEYNLGLSHRRVEAVGNYLAKKYEIDKSRIVLLWYGEEAPVASNDTASGRQKNRRVLGYIGGIE
jgi:OOP family OmpA-OmpF porin